MSALLSEAAATAAARRASRARSTTRSDRPAVDSPGVPETRTTAAALAAPMGDDRHNGPVLAAELASLRADLAAESAALRVELAIGSTQLRPLDLPVEKRTDGPGIFRPAILGGCFGGCTFVS
ncbi:hypothetical protein, partial [Nocardia carnea]|uniref:hypothetical protein n=1 Tax=Nocardia carnea TaxID=37328 RepID=UPI003D76A5C1